MFARPSSSYAVLKSGSTSVTNFSRMPGEGHTGLSNSGLAKEGTHFIAVFYTSAFIFEIDYSPNPQDICPNYPSLTWVQCWGASFSELCMELSVVKPGPRWFLQRPSSCEQWE